MTGPMPSCTRLIRSACLSLAAVLIPALAAAPVAAQTGERPAIAIAADLATQAGSTRLTLTLSRTVEARGFVMERPDRAVIDLPEVNFQLEAGTGSRREGLVQSFRYGLFAPGRSRIVIDLAHLQADQVGRRADVRERAQMRERGLALAPHVAGDRRADLQHVHAVGREDDAALHRAGDEAGCRHGHGHGQVVRTGLIGVHRGDRQVAGSLFAGGFFAGGFFERGALGGSFLRRRCRLVRVRRDRGGGDGLFVHLRSGLERRLGRLGDRRRDLVRRGLFGRCGRLGGGRFGNGLGGHGRIQGRLRLPVGAGPFRSTRLSHRAVSSCHPQPCRTDDGRKVFARGRSVAGGSV
jgi:AMIN domain